jgi:hypothetical protein
LVESDGIDSSIDGFVIGSEIGVQEYKSNWVSKRNAMNLFMASTPIVFCDLIVA